MRNSGTGFLLAWQFFSALPVKRQLDMNTRSVTWMYALLPVIGLLMGAILSGGVLILTTYSEVSNLLLTILLVVGMIAVTGGLHLDGWIDMSDAFFSYGEKEKRLAVLDDPRTGAFGVISVFCLLLLKIGFLYEILASGPVAVIFYILFIPFIARCGMLVYFLTMPTAKQTGLAAYFKKTVDLKLLTVLFCVLCTAFFALWLFIGGDSLFILFGVMLIVVAIYRSWSMKHFGGMSGDLLGALCEGLEVLLWLVALLCI